MNQRAFNLFTALVAFVLIVLSVLLVSMMIKSERTTADSLSDIAESLELQATADLARADALQVFNYGIRYQIEAWLTHKDNYYLLRPDVLTWNDLKDDFVKSTFGGSREVEFDIATGGQNFANRTAKHMTTLLQGAPQPIASGFTITLDSDEAKLREVTQKMYATSIQKGEFIEVIKCDNGNFNNCVGTFYVNMNMRDLSDAEYESLPQIVVTNIVTGRKIREPILPRGNFRIYVPLRVFKALAGALAVAHTKLITDPTDEGIYSLTLHAQLEEMKLGFCDASSCAPRSTPFEPPTTDGLATPCTEAAPGYGYDTADPSKMKERLAEIAKGIILQAANSAAQRVLQRKDGLMPGIARDDFVVVPSAQPSKIIKLVNVPGTGPKPKNFPIGNPQCPLSARGAGLYLDPQTGKPKSEGFSSAAGICPTVAGPGLRAECAEVESFSGILAFTETDQKFQVSQHATGIYKVRFYDTYFVPFNHMFEAVGIGTAPCVARGRPWRNLDKCNDAAVNSEWTCMSNSGIAAPPGGGPITPYCLPPGTV